MLMTTVPTALPRESKFVFCATCCLFLLCRPLECSTDGALGPGTLNDGGPLSANIGSCESYDLLGVRLNRFRLPRDVLGNASVNADEAAAFGITGPSGLLNQTGCEREFAYTFAGHFLNMQALSTLTTPHDYLYAMI